MKKILVGILCFFSSMLIVNASSIDEINMDIKIDEAGNATITETWNAYVNQGTEGWHPYYNLGESKIEVISASMDGKEYEIEKYWNESASLASKAYKAGIYSPTNDEVDVVFGISNYGNHEYQVIYKITNFVSTLNDADIIYWQLMPYDFSAAPGNVSITISSFFEFSDSIDVWGYGKLGAPCYVEGGKIYLTSDGTLKSSEYLTLLAKFDKGTFKTESVLNRDFNSFLSQAEEGSEHYHYKKSYKTPTFFVIFFALFPILFNVFLWTFIIIAISKSSIGSGKRSKANYIFQDGLSKLPKEVENFREIPCNKDVYRAFFLADLYDLNKSRNDFMGVLLLKWIYDNNVKVETIEVKSFFKNKKEDVITFIKPPVSACKHESDLYNYMLAASNDGKLEKNEFKRWCKKHYSKILGWADKVIEYERDELVKQDLLTKEIETKGAIFKFNIIKYRVSNKLYDEAITLKGLKQFLKEFSEIDKKEPIEVKLWHEYLMMAQIFGMAKVVMQRFKDLYPEIVEDMNNYNFNYTTFIFLNSISTSGVSAASSARSAASSYSGGGGGFSSGGGGGGSFGGGGGGGGFR